MVYSGVMWTVVKPSPVVLHSVAPCSRLQSMHGTLTLSLKCRITKRPILVTSAHFPALGHQYSELREHLPLLVREGVVNVIGADVNPGKSHYDGGAGTASERLRPLGFVPVMTKVPTYEKLADS